MNESWFDREALRCKADALEEDNQAPEWLAQALRTLADSESLLPQEEDAQRYVIEYIYPH